MSYVNVVINSKTDHEMSVIKRRKTAAGQQSLLQAAIHGRLEVFGAPSWDQLPVEILVVIFGFLDVNDKLSVMTICERWYAATNVPSVWKDTWVGLKHGLESRSMHFWYALQLRQLSYIALRLRAHNATKDISKLHSMLPRIKGLDLRVPNLNRDHISLEQLTKFKELKTLKLSFTATFVEASCIGSFPLKDMPQLQSLKLSRLSGLSCNASLTFLDHANLSCLELESCGSFNAWDTGNILILLPNLVDLRMHNCSFYGGFIKQQSRTASPIAGRDLTHLSLAGTCFDGAKTFFPARLSKLTSLHLMFCEQRSDQLANLLSSLYHLKELSVRGMT